MVLETKIDRFVSKVEMGRDFFIDAANLLVQMIDEEPDVCERIVAMKRVDWMTMDVLQTFEAIGRKQLAVEAMFLPKHVLNRLIALPVDTQAQIATEQVPVFKQAKRRSTDECIRKPASRLTHREARIAIGPTGIRPIEEQKTIALEPVETVSHGFFEVTLMNGKPFLKRFEKVARAQKVKLDDRGQAVIEIVK